MRKSVNNNHSTKVPFIGMFLLCGLVISLLAPSFTQAHSSYIDAQLKEADTANQRGDSKLAIAAAQQASTLRFTNTKPLFVLGQLYKQQGRYEESIAVYQQIPFKQGYGELGSTALEYQDWKLAATVYQRAIVDEPSAQNYTYLAHAQFNLDHTKEGCEASTQAIRAELSNTQAAQANAACLLMSDKFEDAKAQYPQIMKKYNNNKRSIGYALIEFGVTTKGEQLINGLAKKDLSDWIVLAQISASRGDYDIALERAEKGIAIDVTNIKLNELLAKLYKAQDMTEKADFYLKRVESIRSIE